MMMRPMAIGIFVDPIDIPSMNCDIPGTMLPKTIPRIIAAKIHNVR